MTQHPAHPAPVRTAGTILAAAALLLAASVPAAASGPHDRGLHQGQGHHQNRHASDRTLTVASFNIHHGADGEDVLDLERTAGVIEETGAEVIGLQEVDNHWGDRSDFQDQTAWLAERLDMHYCYSANLDSEPAVGQDERRQYGTAILSEYTLENCANTPLPNHPGGEQRGLAQADLNVRGVDVRFYNTHLTHNDAPARSAQFAVANEVIAEHGGTSILVGDLNDTPESAAYRVFTERLSDVWATVGEGPGYTIPPENPDRRIDYILTSQDITPASAEVVDTDVSDHLPVVAEVTLPHPGEQSR